MAKNLLSSVNHIVVLVLENRCFDHMRGFLYFASGNVSLAGQPFEGPKRNESKPGAGAAAFAVKVDKITPTDANGYLMSGADTGEVYRATNSQLV